jgi:hypothetical protein
VITRRSERGEIGDERDGALYRSVDRGESWERVPLPARVNGPNGIAADPETRGADTCGFAQFPVSPATRIGRYRIGLSERVKFTAAAAK